jgi:hypothetical protein
MTLPVAAFVTSPRRVLCDAAARPLIHRGMPVTEDAEAAGDSEEIVDMVTSTLVV